MISRLMKGTQSVNDYFMNYRFGDAQQSVYSLWIDDICDV
jgi:valyl-tRNA synthetase